MCPSGVSLRTIDAVTPAAEALDELVADGVPAHGAVEHGGREASGFPDPPVIASRSCLPAGLASHASPRAVFAALPPGRVRNDGSSRRRASTSG